MNNLMSIETFYEKIINVININYEIPKSKFIVFSKQGFRSESDYIIGYDIKFKYSGLNYNYVIEYQDGKDSILFKVQVYINGDFKGMLYIPRDSVDGLYYDWTEFICFYLYENVKLRDVVDLKKINSELKTLHIELKQRIMHLKLKIYLFEFLLKDNKILYKFDDDKIKELFDLLTIEIINNFEE